MVTGLAVKKLAEPETCRVISDFAKVVAHAGVFKKSYIKHMHFYPFSEQVSVKYYNSFLLLSYSHISEQIVTSKVSVPQDSKKIAYLEQKCLAGGAVVL